MKAPNKLWLLLLITHTLQAAIYKSVDAQNHIQYSEIPPAEGDFSNIKTAPVANALSSNEVKKNIEKIETEFTKNQEKALVEKKQAQQQAQMSNIKAYNCEQARIYLDKLNSRARIQISQQNGQSKWLTPAELAAEKAKTQEMITKFCEQ